MDTKFCSSQRITMNRFSQAKSGKAGINTDPRFKIIKNRVTPPLGKAITVLRGSSS